MQSPERSTRLRSYSTFTDTTIIRAESDNAEASISPLALADAEIQTDIDIVALGSQAGYEECAKAFSCSDLF